MNIVKSRLKIGWLWLIPLLTLSQVPAHAQAVKQDQARDIINEAAERAGRTAWEGMTTLVIHESQARNTDSGKLQIDLVHTLDTKGRGYRMQISSTSGQQTYGWDGSKFWAVVDGKPGNEAQLKEAKRLISDAFYRFSLPFVLVDPKAEIEYAGKDTVNGAETDSVKITYKGGPVDSYWNTAQQPDHAAVKHQQPTDKHGDHAGAKHGAAETADSKHVAAADDHHSGNQVYFYHFDKDYRIVKIYFSHHGDESYETFLFDNFTSINGITREQSRTLIRAEGNTLYNTTFTRIEFRKVADASLYKSPNR